MIDEKLQKKVDSLSDQERDDIYRYLWAKHVKEDIETYAKNQNYVLDSDDIRILVERYVFDGDYDCNLSYWDNIEALI